MNLSTEKITIIEDTLILNGLKFEDLKLEVIDHIACEIEVLMEENKLSFEENLKLVFEKWTVQLQPSYSFWIRGTKSIPKMVVYKMNKIVKRIMLFSFIIAVIVSGLISLIIKYAEEEEVVLVLNLIVKSLSISVILFFIYAKYKIWKSSHISTFGYLFNKNGFLQIFNLIFISLGIFRFKNDTSFFDFKFMPTFFPILILCLSVSYLNLAYNHLKFNRKRTLEL